VTPRGHRPPWVSCSARPPKATPPSSSPSPNWASPTSGAATAPSATTCSGLALASWEHADNVSFARVSNDQYETAGVAVALSSLIAGDLVFWGSSQTDWTSVYHTAIYVGGGRIVEATGDVVQLNSLGQWGQSDLMANGRRP
jgi:cell wall-associated NlpC family hydrolase